MGANKKVKIGLYQDADDGGEGGVKRQMGKD